MTGPTYILGFKTVVKTKNELVFFFYVKTRYSEHCVFFQVTDDEEKQVILFIPYLDSYHSVEGVVASWLVPWIGFSVHYATIYSSILLRKKHQELFEHFSGISRKMNIFSTEYRNTGK